MAILHSNYKDIRPYPIFQRDFFMKKNGVEIANPLNFITGGLIYSITPETEVKVYTREGFLINQYDISETISYFFKKNGKLYGIDGYLSTYPTNQFNVYFYEITKDGLNERREVYPPDTEVNSLGAIAGILDVLEDRYFVTIGYGIEGSNRDGVIKLDKFSNTYEVLQDLGTDFPILYEIKKVKDKYVAINDDKNQIIGFDSDFNQIWTINLSDLGLDTTYYSFDLPILEYKGKALVRATKQYVMIVDGIPRYLTGRQQMLIIDVNSGSYQKTNIQKMNFIYDTDSGDTYPYTIDYEGDYLVFDRFLWTYGGTALYGYKMRRLGYHAL